MHLRTRYPSSHENGAKLQPVILCFRKKNKAWRFHPGINLIDSFPKRSRWRINPRMGHNGKELVNTRPWYRPWRLTFSQFRDSDISGIMPWGILAVRINQKIAVYCDHPPRPS